VHNEGTADPRRMARALAQLMHRLGYERYGAATPSGPTTSCTGAISRPAGTSPRSRRLTCWSPTSASSSRRGWP